MKKMKNKKKRKSAHSIKDRIDPELMIDRGDLKIEPIIMHCNRNGCTRRATHRIILDVRNAPEYFRSPGMCLKHANEIFNLTGKALRAAL